MEKLKVSVCITVLNEEKSIAKLLDSLLHQTKLPDEIVIADGGSTDKTISLISNKYPMLNLTIIKSKHLNIAQGRNLAIKNSKYPVIAMTDAGCICDKHWLERITEPFKTPKTDIVAGFYKMTGKNNFQKALKPFLGVMPDKFNEDTFLPSTRSIAFTKALWKKVGGFCENLDRAGEDTEFNLQLAIFNFQIKRVKNAIVSWEMPKTINQAYSKFFYYSKGDAQTGKLHSSHNIHTITIFLRYLVLFISLFLSFKFHFLLIYCVSGFLAYLFWAFHKSYKYNKNWRVGIWGIIIQLVSDFAVMAGYISGIWATLNK